MHDCETDPDRDLECRRLGDPLLREKRLPGPVPPGDRAAAAQILEHPRAADRDLGGAGEERPTAVSFHKSVAGCQIRPHLLLIEMLRGRCYRPKCQWKPSARPRKRRSPWLQPVLRRQ